LKEILGLFKKEPVPKLYQLHQKSENGVLTSRRLQTSIFHSASP